MLVSIFDHILVNNKNFLYVAKNTNIFGLKILYSNTKIEAFYR